MSFALYNFDPSSVMVDGYIHSGRYESESECYEAATGLDFYRIELVSDFGACVIYESFWREI